MASLWQPASITSLNVSDAMRATSEKKCRHRYSPFHHGIIPLERLIQRYTMQGRSIKPQIPGYTDEAPTESLPTLY
jgi:hypothetical protein